MTETPPTPTASRPARELSRDEILALARPCVAADAAPSPAYVAGAIADAYARQAWRASPPDDPARFVAGCLAAIAAGESLACDPLRRAAMAH